MMTCEAKTPIGRDGQDLVLAICGNTASGLYRWGCVHEHIKELWACPQHAAGAERRGQVGCFECLREGHECEMVGQLVRLAS
jgi:hypothetical protein